MKKPNTTIDMEVRVALIEQGFKDIRKRLDFIERRLETLSETLTRGLGMWRASLFIFTALSTVAGIILK